MQEPQRLFLGVGNWELEVDPSPSLQRRQIGGQVVDVRIDVRRQQLSMRLEWILNLDARVITRSGKRALRSISETHDDVEVVHADGCSFNSGAWRRCDRYRHLTSGPTTTASPDSSTGGEPVVL